MGRYIIPERLPEKQLSDQNELFGGGFSFPARITEGGTAELSEGKDHVKSCIFHFAEYDFMDLVGVPSFAGMVRTMLFKVFTGDVMQYHEDVMKNGLENWEDRVIDVRVTVGKSSDTDKEQTATMVIQYSLQVTGEDEYLKMPLEGKKE